MTTEESRLDERQRIEDALRVSEGRLSAILQNTPAVIYLMTPESRFVHVNRQFEELFGFKNEEMRGKSVYDLFPPEIAATFASNNRQVIERRAPVEFEETVPHPDGPHTYTSIKAPVFDAAGLPSGIVGISTDVSERKRAEEAIRFQAHLLDTVEQAVIATDPGGTIIYWNRFAESLYGWPAAEAVGRNIMEVTPALTTFEQAAEIMSFLSEGRAWSGEFVVRRRDGTTFPAMVTDTPIHDAEGTMIGMVGVSVDNTERKRLEQELRARAEELAEANRLKDEFLATLSHELRTPLTAVLGWARMLCEGELDEATRAHALEVIMRNAEAQRHLIDEILDVSRIITGKLRIDVRLIELLPVVQAAVETVRPAADARKIQIEMKFDPEANLISGDPERLQQVVWNLLSNAVKFTPQGGRVRARLERVGSHVCITVSDTGQGISPDFLPYVFDRFRQGDQSAARAHSGLGLGLAVVRHLVELHGGTVAARSEGAQKGATFIVKLPLGIPAEETRAPQRAPERTDDEAQSGGAVELDGVRVLIVDDEADARELISAILRGRGAEVTGVESAAEGLKALERARPDVLIADIGMPGEDGYALMRKVRGLDAGRGGLTPAIALTAYVGEDDRARALDAGFNLHLTKPVDAATLTRSLVSLAKVND
jgi:PAS domain S-box-containing protein